MSQLLEWGIFFGRMLVGLTLVVAGTLKIMAGSRWFLGTLLAYDLVHGKTAVLLSKGLPWLEITCGVLLVIGFFTPFAAIAGFFTLLIFTAAVTSAILREKPVDCGCSDGIHVHMECNLGTRNNLVCGQPITAGLTWLYKFILPDGC